MLLSRLLSRSSLRQRSNLIATESGRKMASTSTASAAATAKPVSNWAVPPPSLPLIDVSTALRPELDEKYHGIVQKSLSWHEGPSGREGVLPPLVFGAATLSTIYNSEEYIKSDGPINTVQAALQAGVTAFDTSPHYNESESVLGHALSTLSSLSTNASSSSSNVGTSIYDRESYKLVSKCGHYGGEWDFSRSRVRESVERSLKRLKTEYLDLVYLHDIEFVASNPTSSSGSRSSLSAGPSPSPNPATEKDADLLRSIGIHLDQDTEGKVWGEGDEMVLGAVEELFRMKEEGLIRMVGVSGLPLPTLLRLSILVLHKLGRPLDYVLSYATHTIQSVSSDQTRTTFQLYAPHFATRAKLTTGLVSASPLFMGLLVPRGPPEWHPAPQELRDLAKKVHEEVCVPAGTDVASVAVRFGTRPIPESETGGLPVSFCVGWSNAKEIERGLEGWLSALRDEEKDRALERECVKTFQDGGYGGWMYEMGKQN